MAEEILVETPNKSKIENLPNGKRRRGRPRKDRSGEAGAAPPKAAAISSAAKAADGSAPPVVLTRKQIVGIAKQAAAAAAKPKKVHKAKGESGQPPAAPPQPKATSPDWRRIYG